MVTKHEPPKPKWKWPNATQLLAWAAALGIVITAVLPVLPAGPEWDGVRVALGVIAVVIAKLAQSERKLPPTVVEAHERLAVAGSSSVHT